MIKINFSNYSETWEFEGLKVIQTNKTDKLMIDILKSINNGKFQLFIDEKNVSLNSILTITNFSKTKDLLNFNKSNKFIDYVCEKINFSSLINNEKFYKEIDYVNEEIKTNFLDVNPNKTKFLSSLLEFNNDFLSLNEFKFYLDLNKNNSVKQTIIINNLIWLKLKDIEKFLPFYNFIIFTDNILNIFDGFNVVDLDNIIVNFNSNEFKEIMDFSILSEYLSNKNNCSISKDQLLDTITGKKKDSLFLIKQIAEI